MRALPMVKNSQGRFLPFHLALSLIALRKFIFFVVPWFEGKRLGKEVETI